MSLTLTGEQVREIRRRYALGDISRADLARDFGITPTHIGAIISKRIWKDLDACVVDGVMVRQDGPKISGAEETFKKQQQRAGEIRAKARTDGVSYAKLSKEYGMSISGIRRIVTGKAWKEIE